MNKDTLGSVWRAPFFACAAVFLFVAALSMAADADLTRIVNIPVKGETLVLAGTTPGMLFYSNLSRDGVSVRSTYEPGGADTVVYEAGRDYVVDYRAGTVARTADSRIPDFSANMLYGKKDFDHGDYPGFGNRAFFVYVDYVALDASRLVRDRDASALLPKSGEKLRRGGPFKIIAFGDSITVGIDGGAPEALFHAQWARHLEKLFPKARITVENGATNGGSTVSELPKLREKVLDRAPDLVIIGFGMNDHNINGPTPEQFAENLKTMIAQIRENTDAEVILYSTFPPNPDWKFGSHRMELYAAATQRAAKESACAYADVHAFWMEALARKDPSSMLANNINHPGEFGHWLYFQALKSVVF